MAGLCEGGNEPSGSLKAIYLGKRRKRLVKCFVRIVALYEAETWTMQRSEKKRLEVREMWIWRRMERVKSTDRIRNEFVLERVSDE
ncbi:hypothetical protein ANN_20641 [Periplaneta americana]|uniref:Uncharacterized protein n=1 Tax=Periplaneta americana TaxID=6978 RepID=A0ABQ8SD50_PERAM|nr:hypothetical protein ANN_20641 [Periplaneta americana]